MRGIGSQNSSLQRMLVGAEPVLTDPSAPAPAPLRNLIRTTADSMLHDEAFVEQVAQAALHSLVQSGAVDQAYAGNVPKQQAWQRLKAAARDAFVAELYANDQFIDAVLRRLPPM